MRNVTPRTALCLGFLAALFCLPAAAQDANTNTGDPVADAARKAQEKKKEASKPKKVYTDEDIAGKKSDISVVGNTAAQADQSQANPEAKKKAEATADGKEKEDPNSEKAWRARFAKLRDKIAVAEDELSVLQREESKAGVQYYADPTKAMNE